MAMSSHVTLRGLLGLGDAPAALQDSALIMIDCQNTYRRGVMQLEGAEDAFAEAARVLARARASGVPVFHIMHDAGQGSPYDITAEIGQISDEVAPIAGSPWSSSTTRARSSRPAWPPSSRRQAGATWCSPGS
jgi:nicotinamidase-related amidase